MNTEHITNVRDFVTGLEELYQDTGICVKSHDEVYLDLAGGYPFKITFDRGSETYEIESNE